MSATLDRTLFSTSRAGEFFAVRSLQTRTGQPASRFAAVVLKELVDNALDACESAGVAPELGIEVARRDDELVIAVTDNGAGLTPAALSRILDFDRLVSDKAHYRSPTRGAQGNALKTVLGIPHALGCTVPVVVESCGVRHGVRCWVDAAGEVRVDHTEEEAETVGTRIVVTLLADGGQKLDARWWALAFAFVNPHATVRIEVGFALSNPHASVRIEESETAIQHAELGDDENADSYRCCFSPSVEAGNGWRKFLPTDLTAPHWYDAEALARLIAAHGAATRNGGRDLPLRDFVRQFRGLSGTAAAKVVCDTMGDVRRLSEVDGHTAEFAGELLAAMKAQAKAPSPKVLGCIGEAHLVRTAAEVWDVKRHWYKKAEGDVDGVPFVVEAALIETASRGVENVYATNFSPSFGDPLSRWSLAHGDVSGYGVRGFLYAAHSRPDAGDTVCVFHLICPSLAFLDAGKTALNVPAAIRGAASKVLWAVAKERYREEKSRQRGGAQAERLGRSAWRAPRPMSMKEVVYEVLPASLAHATGGGEYPVSARQLYYAVRARIQEWTDKELDYTYFSQTLLIQYRDAGGRLDGLYYDARGYLLEPHTGTQIPMGTLAVESYGMPQWRYDKILFVEKKGLLPTLCAAKIAERFDLAIIASEGFATEAARTLLRRADSQRDYRIFVLHDADPAGYEIARTLAEETARMPGYSVAVEDLGLRLTEAVEMELQSESYTEKRRLPSTLKLADEIEREYFGGRRGNDTWTRRRIELNAMTAPQLVGFIERKLVEAGADGKVIPPAEELKRKSAELRRNAVRARLGEMLAAAVGLDALTASMLQRLPDATGADLRAEIEESFGEDRSVAWDAALQSITDEVVDTEENAKAMRESVRTAITDATA